MSTRRIFELWLACWTQPKLAEFIKKCQVAYSDKAAAKHDDGSDDNGELKWKPPIYNVWKQQSMTTDHNQPIRCTCAACGHVWHDSLPRLVCVACLSPRVQRNNALLRWRAAELATLTGCLTGDTMARPFLAGSS